MLVDDPVLPAASHLTGRHAERVLGAALEAVGGTVQLARPCHLHYRPGHGVVVRFDSRVNWTNGGPRNETLLVATTVDGAPPGTLPVEAIDDEGRPLVAGVWRWPFDPVLHGLADAVTPSAASAFLGAAARGRLDLTVVAFRPTQRAVVRAVDSAGAEFYLKAIPPKEVPALVDRHRRLLDAGVPVPEIINDDPRRGLIAMTALSGPTVRDRIKRGQRLLPGAGQYERIYDRLADVRLPARKQTLGRTAGALHHAAMLSSLMPHERGRLERLDERLRPAAERAAARSGATIHGDLYEAQLVTGRGRGGASTITGVLDLDDCGPGDPLDDRATVLAHLIDRLLDPHGRAPAHLAEYTRALRAAFAERTDRVELDLVTAGVLVGLATGPIRVQQRHWHGAVRRRLTIATRLAGKPGLPTLSLA